MANKQATLAEIARVCRVSPSTVSRSLHGHPHISQETKDAIHKVARSLNYRANSPARALVSGRSNLVAFVHGEPDTFWADVCHVARRVLHSRHFAPIDCVTDESPEWEKEIIESLLAQLVAGIIWQPFSSPIIDKIARRVASTNTPLVVLDRFVPGCPATFVYTDDVHGASVAMRHVLTERQHRRIALLVGPHQSQTMRWRKEGFLAAVDEAGIPRKQVTALEIRYGYRPAYEKAREVLSQPERPTAILAARDEDAWGALDAARDLGIRVPEELRIVGYGDCLPPHYTRCRLTTVSQNRGQIVTKAVEALAEEMKGDYQPEHKSVVVPVKLVIGDT